MEASEATPATGQTISHPAGTFCWWDLGTTDAGAAKKFYTSLLGWEAVDIPVGDGMVYTMMVVDGKQACALSSLPKEMIDGGIPPIWSSYIAVDDVDATVEKAKSLGGEVMMEPMDVMEEGRMAMIEDPTGAMFGIWQPKNHKGAGHVNKPGGVCWTELATREADRAAEFYAALFGWQPQQMDMPGDTKYTMLMMGETQVGGIIQMTDEWGDMPPHWMVYFSVDDCDATAARAQELGGKTPVPPTDIPPVGRFSVIRDPQGGHFSVIKLSNPS